MVCANDKFITYTIKHLIKELEIDNNVLIITNYIESLWK